MGKRYFGSLLLLALNVAGAETLFLESAGTRLHYSIQGAGPPVILIHGYAQSIATNWDAPGISRGLAVNFRVIALDMRGHGVSQKPHDSREYGLKMVEDVIQLMDHLGIRKAHVVGYSLGGRIVCMLLARHSDRLLTATLGGAGLPEEADRQARARIMSRLADSLENGGGAEALLKELTPHSQSPSPEQVDSFNKLFRHANDPLALAAVARSLEALQPSERSLRANLVPALAIVGEFDPRRGDVNNLAQAMRNLEVLVIPAANHMTAVGDPRFLQAVQQFLQAHR